jgi:hypothetical protein
MRTLHSPRRPGFLRRSIGLLSAAALLAVAPTARAALLSHWTFDSVTGTEKPFYPDATGNRSAFLANKDKVSVYAGEAPFGKAVAFNGETGAHLTAKPNFGFNKLPATVCVWVNLGKVAPNFIVTDWESTAKASYVFGIDPGVNKPNDKNYLIADLAGTNTRSRTDPSRRSVARLATKETIPVNEWHHIAWVYDRTSTTEAKLIVYIDGKEIASANAAGPQARVQANPGGLVDVALGGPEIRIGSREMGDVPFNGAMDELWVFNEALKPEQIRNLMAYNNLGGNGQVTKLVKMNDDGSIALALAAKPETPKPKPAEPAKATDTAKPAEPKPAEPKPAEPKPAEPAVAQAPPAPAPTPAVAANPAPSTPAPPHETQTASNNTPATNPPAAPAATPAHAAEHPTPAAPRPSEPDRTAARPSVPPPPNLGKDVIAKVPTGYSALRLTGIFTCAAIALFLMGFLVWAMGEKARMRANG